MKSWDRVYSDEFGGMWYPSEGVVRFTARYISRRVGINKHKVKKEVNKVLDVGCGNGRHVIFFAEQGFNIYGIDISSKAIKMAKAWLNQRKLKANLKIGDIKKLEYKDAYFDLVICFGTLDHLLFKEAKEVVKEIRRILVPKGYFFVTLRSVESSEYGRGELIDKNTFILEVGYEKGLIQHYFELKEIEELLDGFKVFDLEVYEERFPSIYTVDKHFLQSSQGVKRYIELKEPLDLNLKEARWYIAAEKI